MTVLVGKWRSLVCPPCCSQKAFSGLAWEFAVLVAAFFCLLLLFVWQELAGCLGTDTPEASL